MNTEELMTSIIEAQERHIARLAELMERSEARIDQTNQMIRHLVDTTQRSHTVLESVTKQYSEQLTSLSECRNALLTQNGTLIKQHEKDQAEKRELRKDMRETRDKIFELIRQQSLNVGAGVKVENII